MDAINKITKEQYPDVFADLMEWSIGETYHQHRRNSNYFTKALIEFNQKSLPEHPELHGKWETDRFINDYEDGPEYGGEPSTLYRVEEKTRMVEEKYYERIA